MPSGVIIDCLSVFLGGIFGALAGNFISEDFKKVMNWVFGLCSMGMGISSIMLMENMPAVILSVVLGTALGLSIGFGRLINSGGMSLARFVGRVFKNNNSAITKEEYIFTLVTAMVLFCASGTGIYGCLDAGMTGDSTVLISKAILDFFTAAIFACGLGFVVSSIAIPQFIIFSILILCSRLVMPFVTSGMTADFKACGGFLIIAIGFRILRLIDFPVADMILAMVIVMPLSFVWSEYIAAVL